MDIKEYNRLAAIKNRSKPIGKSAILLRHAKARSNKYNFPFDLDRDWVIKKLKAGICELSKIPFDLTANGKNHFNPYGPSIDRIDPQKGYTKNNCRIILICINFAIGQWGIKNYLTVAKTVIDTQRY